MRTIILILCLIVCMGGVSYGGQADMGYGPQPRPSINDHDARPVPPPEAYQACEGKSTGSVSQFVNPRGETVQGTCEEEAGRLVLRPDRNRINRSKNKENNFGKGAVAE